MSEQIVNLSPEEHKGYKIKEVADYSHAKNFNLAAITVDEFATASANFPIVFVKDKDSEKTTAVCLFGLEPGQNLFINDSGHWEAVYVPAIIRRFPFTLTEVERDGQHTFAVAVTHADEYLNEKVGIDLFDKDGKPSAHLTKVQTFLGQLQEMQGRTLDLISLLEKYDLLKPQALEFEVGEEKKSIGGFHIVDQIALRQLTDEQYLDLRHKGALDAIYVHLNSMSQMRNLVARASA